MNVDHSPFLVIWETTQARDLSCAHSRASAIPRRHPQELTTNEGYRLLDAVKISGSRRQLGDGFEAFEEPEADYGTDSARYLAAGATRAIWFRVSAPRMEQAAWELRRLAASARRLIVELLRPDLYLLGLDFSVKDFKDSARHLFRRADAYVVSKAGLSALIWDRVPALELDRRPTYEIPPPDYRPRGLIRECMACLGLGLVGRR